MFSGRIRISHRKRGERSTRGRTYRGVRFMMQPTCRSTFGMSWKNRREIVSRPSRGSSPHCARDTTARLRRTIKSMVTAKCTVGSAAKRHTALRFICNEESIAGAFGILDVKPHDLLPPVAWRLRFQFLTISNVTTYVPL